MLQAETVPEVHVTEFLVDKERTAEFSLLPVGDRFRNPGQTRILISNIEKKVRDREFYLVLEFHHSPGHI